MTNTNTTSDPFSSSGPGDGGGNPPGVSGVAGDSFSGFNQTSLLKDQGATYDPVFMEMYEAKMKDMFDKKKNIPFTKEELVLFPTGFVRTAVWNKKSRKKDKDGREVPRTENFDQKASKYFRPKVSWDGRRY